MSQSKENLQLLLKFISKLLEQEGNDWFHDELANLISKKIISQKDTEIKLAAVQFRELGSIDKYIENGIIPLIDFSDIVEEDVRYTLERDCIEMGKCRFSHFGQTPSFFDFCKHAFFQIEQLVNYYITRKNEYSFNKSVDYIKKYNEKSRIDGKKTISSITFSDKLFAIMNQTGMTFELKSILDKVSYARNNSLHRSSESASSLISIYPAFQEAIKKNKSLQSSEDKEIIKEYYFLKFIEDRDYDAITSSIVMLKKIIVKNLS